MRKTVMYVGIPVAALGIATAVAIGKFHSGPKAGDTLSADLQSAQAMGLDLAQAQDAKKYALTEVAPESKPDPAKTIKPSNGPKAIRSKKPTVKAAPEPVAAQAVEETTQAESPATAAPTPAAVPTPSPVPQTGESDGPILAGGTARGRTGGGEGGIMGAIFGAIIRGGVVDGDNCDPRPTRGGRRPETPIYRGYPMGIPGGNVGGRGSPTGVIGSRGRPGRL